MKLTSKVINDETWVNKKWRPAMAWTYMAICIFDFIIAPTLNYIFFSKVGGDFISWKPLTMADGGLFHLAMGAIVGITSWQRGKEKMVRYTSPRYESEYEDRAEYRDRLAGNASREAGPLSE